MLQLLLLSEICGNTALMLKLLQTYFFLYLQEVWHDDDYGVVDVDVDEAFAAAVGVRRG
jgi:hypothetical protein